ncbi:MAG: hypothetical protein R6U65_13440 [Perlabentimonas sp.]
MELGVKFIISIGLFLIVLALGFILNKVGKPYNDALFNAHKLISLGMVVYLSYVIYNFAKLNDLNFNLYFFISLAVLSLIALFVSGAFLSMDRMSKLTLNIHRLSTGSFTISLIIVLYRVFLVKH